MIVGIPPVATVITMRRNIISNRVVIIGIIVHQIVDTEWRKWGGTIPETSVGKCYVVGKSVLRRQAGGIGQAKPTNQQTNSI
jgi:hypothetical protein